MIEKDLTYAPIIVEDTVVVVELESVDGKLHERQRVYVVKNRTEKNYVLSLVMDGYTHRRLEPVLPLIPQKVHTSFSGGRFSVTAVVNREEVPKVLKRMAHMLQEHASEVAGRADEVLNTLTTEAQRYI